MSKAQVVVTVRADGTVAAETVGIAGPKCMDVIATLEYLLEAKVTDSVFTADYHRSRQELDAVVDQRQSGTEGVRA